MLRWPRRFMGLQRRQLFNIYVLVGGVGIVLAVTLFTLQMAQKVDDQSRETTRIFSSLASRFWGAQDDAQLLRIMQIMLESEIPFIVTDNAGRPMMWNATMLGIPLPDDFQVLLQEDLAAPNDPALIRLLDLLHEFDAANEPFAIINPETQQRMGTLHYGPSALSQRIRWMPYLELALLTIFFLLIVWALQMKKVGEQQRLFAGMAKETAHQLGTPITSIMGWLAILRDRSPGGDDILDELDKDVDRLSKISARFSQIGSRPRRSSDDLSEVVASTIVYFQRRLPHLGGQVQLASQGELTNRCQFNRDLMEWVLENLIKNGIDALKDGEGAITVELADGPNASVRIRVSDTGHGIAARVRNHIFEPGFTTKSRGWGMGLALVKRIITQYHDGRIEVVASGTHGTTFEITLPGEEN